MNKRYTPTCFFAHIGVYQHRSPSVPETGKRQRGYVYPQRIGCGEHRFNRGFAPLEQSSNARTPIAPLSAQASYSPDSTSQTSLAFSGLDWSRSTHRK